MYDYIGKQPKTYVLRLIEGSTRGFTVEVVKCTTPMFKTSQELNMQELREKLRGLHKQLKVIDDDFSKLLEYEYNDYKIIFNFSLDDIRKLDKQLYPITIGDVELQNLEGISIKGQIALNYLGDPYIQYGRIIDIVDKDGWSLKGEGLTNLYTLEQMGVLFANTSLDSLTDKTLKLFQSNRDDYVNIYLANRNILFMIESYQREYRNIRVDSLLDKAIDYFSKPVYMIDPRNMNRDFTNRYYPLEYTDIYGDNIKAIKGLGGNFFSVESIKDDEVTLRGVYIHQRDDTNFGFDYMLPPLLRCKTYEEIENTLYTNNDLITQLDFGWIGERTKTVSKKDLVSMYVLLTKYWVFNDVLYLDVPHQRKMALVKLGIRGGDCTSVIEYFQGISDESYDDWKNNILDKLDIIPGDVDKECKI